MNEVDVLVRIRKNQLDSTVEEVPLRIFTDENFWELTYISTVVEDGPGVSTAFCKRFMQGCKHELSNLAMVCRVCNATYSCARCHDASENHSLSLLRFICCICGSENDTKSKECRKCSVALFSYACDTCRCYCFPLKARSYFHCDQCRKCICGHKNEFVHCKVCNECIQISKFLYHLCQFSPERLNCPFCARGLKAQFKRAACGCSMHYECYYKQMAGGLFVCRRCHRSILDESDARKASALLKTFATSAQEHPHHIFECCCGFEFTFPDKKCAICPRCGDFTEHIREEIYSDEQE